MTELVALAAKVEGGFMFKLNADLYLVKNNEVNCLSNRNIYPTEKTENGIMFTISDRKFLFEEKTLRVVLLE
jgi:hypothetical protein